MIPVSRVHQTEQSEQLISSEQPEQSEHQKFWEIPDKADIIYSDFGGSCR